MARKPAARSGAGRSRRSPRGRSSADRKQLRFAFGARRQEIAGVLLMALAVVTLLALLDVTTGSLIDAWRNFLTYLIGLGAYAFAIALGLAGALLFRRALGARIQRRWIRFIGLESAFFAALAALHAGLGTSDPWALIEQGTGGGVVGWGMSAILVDLIGSTLTALLFIVVALAGLTLAFQIDWGFLLRGLLDVLGRLRDWAFSSPEPAGDGRPPNASTKTTRRVSIAQTRSQPATQVSPEPASDVPLVRARQASPSEGYAGVAYGDVVPSAAAKLEQPQLPLYKNRNAITPQLPPIDLLEVHTVEGFVEQEAKDQARIIEDTLRHFGLQGKIVDISRGPAVTQFGLEPGYVERSGPDGQARQQKVRVGQITSLANDLALALSASSLRIEAPVPGKGYIGIEVPNERISLVSLRGVIDSDEFAGDQKSLLKIALGRDVGGRPVVTDMTSMPHLLIAGTTGSGKSVLISALTAGLTFNKSPQDLRLVMIDPKMVELIRFNGLPHLYGKVEVETERINGVLRWAMHEMDERYKRFSDIGARNLVDYNNKMVERGEEKLPMIVIMIDELADLMLSTPVETERTICRLAQMARATGMHLVVATQRPSTDVVTGLIKANFPARIAFAVASSIDSRVILDSVGAETLLGRGDMLFQSPELGSPVRVQGCFVSDHDVENLVAFWSDQYKDAEPEPAPWDASMSRLIKLGSGKSSTLAAADDDETLLQQAIDLVRREGGASASLLQRKMRLGYPKAARLIDEMYEKGIIGPPVEAGRTREVLPPKR